MKLVWKFDVSMLNVDDGCFALVDLLCGLTFGLVFIFWLSLLLEFLLAGVEAGDFALALAPSPSF